MPFTHLRGSLKSPTRQSRSGDGAPPRHCTSGFTLNTFTVNGFTLNGFTVNGFISPVDARQHGCSRKPFRICSYKKCARNSFAMCTYKTKDLNFFGINTYKKHRGGYALLYLLYFLCSTVAACGCNPVTRRAN